MITGPSLLVFADDWGRHPSSCQHLVSRLLPRYPVTWVNTIGMRRPTLDLSTLRRGLEKLRHWSTPREPALRLPENLQVVSPMMWPWFTRGADRWLNRGLLLRGLTPVVRAMPRPVVAVTTIPIVADLLGRLPVDRWVYYCVDDFSVWPGLDHAAMIRMEEAVVRGADHLLAVSEVLRERLAQSGRDASLLTHGVDLDLWRGTHGGSSPRMPDAIAQYERPLVLFWGLIDRRMDPEYVRGLAGAMERGTVLLVGPQDNPDPELGEIERVRLLPPVPYADLPAWAGAADVLVMPYRDIPVTRAMQPLKMKEYLATGKPVVVRDLPSTRPWADCLDLAASSEEFVGAVRRRLCEGIAQEQSAARARLSAEGWDAKAAEFERVTGLRLPGCATACD
jgi:glycosyltransferase involved in cell wall biosynthesis